MKEIDINDRVRVAYEYEPIYASANLITGTKYFTKLYILSNGNKYFMGEWDEKLDEDQIKARFTEHIKGKQEQQYGTRRSIFRRDLQPKERGGAFQNKRLRLFS